MQSAYVKSNLKHTHRPTTTHKTSHHPASTTITLKLITINPNLPTQVASRSNGSIYNARIITTAQAARATTIHLLVVRQGPYPPPPKPIP